MFAISAKIAFLCCAFTSEAARMQNKKKAVAVNSSAKIDDLDWEGCASWTCKKEGCAVEKLWLDTPRQSCRFTEEYKLRPEQIARFFPVELARLEKKSEKFARTGCLFGGWWSKCWRRSKQIRRLLNYCRLAKEKAAKFDTSHEAYALVTSSETQEALLRTSRNVAAGYKKFSKTSTLGLFFDSALTDMMNVQASAKQIAEQASSEGEDALENGEKQALEDTLAVEAMLKMINIKLTVEQRAALYAKIEAGSDVQGDSLDENLIVEEGQALDKAFEAAEKESKNGELFTDLSTQEDGPNSTESPMSLIETAAERQALSTQKTGPLKWLFKHGLGWLVTRIGWMILFLFGVALGVIRAALFPILFIGCTAVKFLVWLFRDVGYNLMWEGETQLVANRFTHIGRCAPVMWDFVGFDATASNVVGQVIIQPAQFASKHTGVHHLYKSQKDLCKDVQCGAFASCTGGQCYCDAGYYPWANPGEEATSCGQAVTTAGCVCQSIWSSGAVITQSHYGCPTSKYKCKVDTKHPTYATCHSKIKTKKGDIVSMAAKAAKNFVFGQKAPVDTCTPLTFRARVAKLNVKVA